MFIDWNKDKYKVGGEDVYHGPAFVVFLLIGVTLCSWWLWRSS